jgi:tRNA A-37 threonylcarbamoyl transferase component Bud32
MAIMSIDARISQLLLHYEDLQAQGQAITPEDLCRDCPELLATLKHELQGRKDVKSLRDPATQSEIKPPTTDSFEIRGETGQGGASADSLRDRAAQSEIKPPVVDGYEILGELGHGGMGVVYKARQVRLNRLVALKMIRAGALAGPESLARFPLEARAVARLHHPHIVQIYEIGEQDGQPYFSLEFVDGGTLAQKMAGQPQPPAAVARLVETLARAMDHAHRQGVIHRDLKPANVLLAGDGTPKITDFGLAKQLDDAEAHTQSGAILGTPAYMAPEQASADKSAIGPLTDVYALGVILYELLTGQPPFRGGTLEILEQVRYRDPPPPRRLQPRMPRDLETICLKALAKEPRGRYPSALALAQDLELFSAGESIRGRREGLSARLWRKVRRKPLASASVLLVLLALAVAGYIGPAAYRDRQVASLLQEIASELQTPALAQPYLEHVEARIAELEGFAPAEAASAHRRLHERFAGQIRAQFHDRLGPEEAAPLRTAIALLASRDAALADLVGKEFRQRLTSWEPVFQLAPPFADLKTVFFSATDPLPGTGNALWRAGAGTSEAGPQPFLYTRKECAGNVRFIAEFDPSWINSPQVGLMLAAPRGQAYTFLLSIPESFNKLGEGTPRQPLPATFATAARAGKTAAAAIIRKGLLAIERFPAAELFAGQAGDRVLRLEIKREGEVLTFQVNQRKAVVFHDLFPLSLAESVRFGIFWPGGVGLTNLEAQHLTSPAVPSALETGDDLYNRGDQDRAVPWYRQAALEAKEPAVRQEARCKEGLCLVALKRPDEAIPVFQEVAAEAGPEATLTGSGRWPLMADCQLLLIYHRQPQPAAQAAARTILDKLAARASTRDGELNAFIPYSDRDSIVNAHIPRGFHAFVRKPEDVVADCEWAHKAAVLFEPDVHNRMGTWLQLATAYHLAGRDVEALGTVEALVRDFQEQAEASGLWGGWIFDQYGWLLRRRGDARQALTRLDHWLFPSAGALRRDSRGSVYFGLVERARIHCALELWKEAEEDLELFFRMESGESQRYYGFHAAACLLHGFLRERSGDQAGAQAAWRRGLLQSWAQDNPDDPSAHLLAAPLNISLVYHLIMASLTGEIGEREAEDLLLRVSTLDGAGAWGGAGNILIPQLIKSEKKLMSAVLRETWRTPRGRDWARRLAFRQLSYAEYLQVPFFLVGAEFVHQGALPAKLSPQQDALVWKLVHDCHAAYVSGSISRRHVLSLGTVWEGFSLPGFGFGWKEVDNSVLKKQPQIRGPLAYVFGHRSLRLNRPRDAVTFFVTARDTAPAGSPLHRLAQDELDRLKAK